jgi:hypothetical protein
MDATDPVLAPLLRAGTAEGKAQAIEEILLTVVRPLTRRILARFPLVQPHDAEDVDATIALRVTAKLQAIADGRDDAVQKFDGYVATLAYNVIYDVLRERHPERTRLKARLRHAIQNDARLAMWSAPSGFACGLASMRDATSIRTTLDLPDERVTAAMRDLSRPADAVAAVFDVAPEPVAFDALITTMADLWHIDERRGVDAGEQRAREPHAAARLETLDLLRAVWREIRELRPLQRKALLLNLRDRETANVVSLVALTGVATIAEIATAMEMSREELGAIWNDLPLDDLRIAAMLGVTRQQVINLRKSARERLARRVFRPVISDDRSRSGS